MPHRQISIAAIFFCFSFVIGPAAQTNLKAAAADTTSPAVNLAGQWRFAMDRDDVGVKDGWISKDLTDRINLPGILQSQGYGDEISVDTPWVAALPRDMRWYLLPQYKAYTEPGHVKVPYLSQPPRHYLGVAWYQRDIEIPKGWQDKCAHLFLERPRWETTVWVDDQKIGSNNSLVAPHEYVLGILTLGKHRLSVRADNRMNIVPGYRPDGHSVSDALGYSWNGIAGRIELTATSPVWIDDAQLFPNVERKSATVRIKISNLTGQSGSGTLDGNIQSPPNEEIKHPPPRASTSVQWDAKGGEAVLEFPAGSFAETWDEFHPVLQRVTIKLKGAKADDTRQLTFGLREIKANDKQFLLNGTEINLRGTHSGGDFPLTGYPATDVESWKKIVQTCKDFGLNHMRFHSWCPPDAAFTAADELGFYIQPECGMWNPFNVGSPISLMLEEETARMMKAYGNHPSFLLLSPSNEPAGRWQQVLLPWAAKWYERDPRRLYAANTGRSNPQDAGPQYAIVPIRSTRGWFGRDFGQQLQNAHMPVVSHEVGQWCAFPDFDVMKKFTGYLQPGNYEIFRDSAAAHGVLEKDKEFAHASGRFQVACYKEEIEANLRTPGLAGFQLLDLHDYLGQGGALIGVLDAFWGDKGYVTADEFRKFCSPTVPLARFHSYLFKTSDPFDVKVEVAHFGPAPIESAQPVWKIVSLDGEVVAHGQLPSLTIPIGKNTPLGTITADLLQLHAPAQYKLIVGFSTSDKKSTVENDWNFWLYPAHSQPDSAVPDDLLLTSKWSDAQARLSAGGKVLFVPPASAVDDTCPPLDAVPVFWNRLMNPKLSAMLGLLCDTKHPALAEFPTEANCDWQWTDLVRGVRTVNLDHAPPALQPIVQAIDDWSRNYKLAVVFECKVGDGRLLVCTIDIQSNLEKRPSAQQLRESLVTYMRLDNRFQPQVALTAEQANSLWPGLTGRGFKAGPQGPASPDIDEGPAAAQPKRQ